MGNGQTKEEQLYQAVQNGNHNAVKALRRDGASLEWVDKEGRTPLILACTRGDLFEMVLTLLKLGANMNAYRPGTHGGFPLHHAAKRGLDKTVLLLLSHGADPLLVNDDALTPLDMARNRGHVSVVRMIEDRICLFSGVVRELAGPGFLEALAPQWVTKKIWVVVLPAETDRRRHPRFELVIYQSPKVPLPRTIILLAKAEVEEPKLNSQDPVLVITDKSTKTKYKFLSEQEGDKVQLERLYKACKGIPQVPAGSGGPGTPSQVVLQGLSALIRPTTQQQPPNFPTEPTVTSSTTPHSPSPGKLVSPTEGPFPDDVALAMAIDASIRSASEEGIPVSPVTRQSSDDLKDRQNTSEGTNSGWGGSSESKTRKSSDGSKYGGWVDDEKQSNYGGWSSSTEAGPSRVHDSPKSQHKVSDSVPPVIPKQSETTPTTTPLEPAPAPVAASPSAPPLPAQYIAPGNIYDGPIHYPSIDTSPIQVDFSSVTPPDVAPAAPKVDEKTGGSQCVVCWDAPAQGVCIPCGHLAGCMDCLSEIKAKDWGCPVCRASIQQVVKVYAV